MDQAKRQRQRQRRRLARIGRAFRLRQQTARKSLQRKIESVPIAACDRAEIQNPKSALQIKSYFRPCRPTEGIKARTEGIKQVRYGRHFIRANRSDGNRAKLPSKGFVYLAGKGLWVLTLTGSSDHGKIN